MNQAPTIKEKALKLKMGPGPKKCEKKGTGYFLCRKEKVKRGQATFYAGKRTLFTRGQFAQKK
jgi:hypothetical protein